MCHILKSLSSCTFNIIARRITIIMMPARIENSRY
jgi:hypothetical protein